MIRCEEKIANATLRLRTLRFSYKAGLIKKDTEMARAWRRRSLISGGNMPCTDDAIRWVWMLVCGYVGR